MNNKPLRNLTVTDLIAELQDVPEKDRTFVFVRSLAGLREPLNRVEPPEVWHQVRVIALESEVDRRLPKQESPAIELEHIVALLEQIAIIQQELVALTRIQKADAGFFEPHYPLIGDDPQALNQIPPPQPVSVYPPPISYSHWVDDPACHDAMCSYRAEMAMAEGPDEYQRLLAENIELKNQLTQKGGDEING